MAREYRVRWVFGADFFSCMILFCVDDQRKTCQAIMTWSYLIHCVIILLCLFLVGGGQVVAGALAANKHKFACAYAREY